MEEKERFEVFGNVIKDNEQMPTLLDNYQATIRLNEFSQRIADLEAKLAESESKRKSLEEKVKFLTEETEENFVDGQKYNELKQQLAEKEEEIKRLKIYDEYRFELPYPKVKILGKTFEDIQELIDKWLKQGSKDKISFAIEQLEKVKDFVSRQLFITTKDCNDLDEAEAKGCNELREETIKEINNQIKELKGEE